MLEKFVSRSLTPNRTIFLQMIKTIKTTNLRSLTTQRECSPNRCTTQMDLVVQVDQEDLEDQVVMVDHHHRDLVV